MAGPGFTAMDVVLDNGEKVILEVNHRTGKVMVVGAAEVMVHFPCKLQNGRLVSRQGDDLRDGKHLSVSLTAQDIVNGPCLITAKPFVGPYSNEWNGQTPALLIAQQETGGMTIGVKAGNSAGETIPLGSIQLK